MIACPWSAYYQDIVAAVQKINTVVEYNPNMAINDGMPYILYTAFLYYKSQLGKSRNYFRELEREKARKERDAK